MKRKEPQNPSREVSGSGKYISGCLLEFDKEWYHGEQTREEAEEALKIANEDCFLIRHCKGVLVLSIIHDAKIAHTKIDYGPGCYQLDGAPHQNFSELQELVNHYRNNPISDEVTLGAACGKMKDHDTG